jgi:hypothetical protein
MLDLKLGGNMKYIMACLISFGIASAGFAQDYSDDKASASGRSTHDPNYKHQNWQNSGLYDRETRMEYPNVDPAKNDHLMPAQGMIEEMDEVIIKSEIRPELEDESSFIDPNDHLPIGKSQVMDSELLSTDENELLQEQEQTEFGKTCTLKRLESGHADLSSAESFKIEDKNLKAERKANGEQNVKFHNKNEDLKYHQSKSGKSKYKYSFKDRNTDLKVEKRKSGEGYIILKSENIEEDASALLDQGGLGVERDIVSCMR